jgi:hypothetical protein
MESNLPEVPSIHYGIDLDDNSDYALLDELDV